MKRKAVSSLVLMLLLTSMLSSSFVIQPVKAGETIYIRADGSIDPPTANITTTDNVTYAFTDNNYDSIVVERSNTTIDGQGYTLQGTFAADSKGISLIGIVNVTIRNINIKSFQYGIWLDDVIHNTITNNTITNNGRGIQLRGSSNNTINGNNITSNIIHTVIYGEGIFLFYSSNNTINRNNITANNSWGVYISSSSNNNISGNNITNSPGVIVQSSSENVIGRNNIANSPTGVYLLSSSDNTINRNNITDSELGILLSNSPDNTISGNAFIEDGLYVWDYPSPNSFGNSVVNNTVNGKPLVYLEGASNLTVENAGQVILVKCENITVQNLNLSHTTIGVELLQTNNTKITNNTITNNFWSVELFASSNNTISRNNITANNGWGVFLDSSSNNTISGNAFSDGGLFVSYYPSPNSFGNSVVNNTVNGEPLVYLEGASNLTVENAGQVILVKCENITVENLNLSYTSIGVELVQTNNTKITNNTITNNLEGVHLSHSPNNVVSRNSIAGNGQSVNLFGSSNNVVTRNNITSNGLSPQLSGSNNKIYHNSFVNNGPFYSTESVNVWDNGYPSGGNYWSDYTGVDLYSGANQNETGSDGIGDTPFVVGGNNTDRYPLMVPISPLTQEGENVTVLPTDDVALIFENVTSEGLTTVNETEVGPEPSAGFKLAGKYYNIETTATYAGNITVRIIYDDTNMTLEEEVNLQLMQWNETLLQWVDITTQVDTESNVIYGQTTHLSAFASMKKLLGDVDGDGDVDIFDIVTMAGVYGTSEPDPRYNPVCDIDRDGDVDIFDIVIAAGNYGESW